MPMRIWHQSFTVLEKLPAYAEALAATGVPVEQLKARGHFHSSLTMVDVVITGVSGREQMAEALRGFAGLPSNRQDNEVPREIAAE